MAFAGFSDLNECRLYYDDDKSVDNPDEYCRWLKENSDVAKDADQILLEVDVDYVSAVDTPAQDSEWVAVKEEDGEDRLRTNGDLIVKSEDERKAYAAVLVADDIDKQQDVVPSFVVRKAAHRFMKKFGDDWGETADVDSDHDNRGGKGVPVESWTLKEDKSYETVGGESKTYPEGTWMMEVEFKDDDTWKRVKSGELSGWSIEGPAVAESVAKQVQDANTTDDTDSIMSDDEIEALTEGMNQMQDDLSTLTEEVSKVVEAQATEKEEEDVEKDADDSDDLSVEDVEEVAKNVAQEVVEEMEDDDPEDVQKEVDRKVSKEDVETETPEEEGGEIDYGNIEL